MAIRSQGPGFLLLDSLVAIVLSLVMLSVVAGTVISMKVRMAHQKGDSDSSQRQTGIEKPIVRLDISYRSRGFSDEFAKNLSCVCTEISGDKPDVYFRERTNKARIPSS